MLVILRGQRAKPLFLFLFLFFFFDRISTFSVTKHVWMCFNH